MRSLSVTVEASMICHGCDHEWPFSKHMSPLDLASEGWSELRCQWCRHRPLARARGPCGLRGAGVAPAPAARGNADTTGNAGFWPSRSMRTGSTTCSSGVPSRMRRTGRPTWPSPRRAATWRPWWPAASPKKESAGGRPPGCAPDARPGRGLRLPEIRRRLWRLGLRVPRGVRRVLAWSHWRRRHPWVAQGCHYRRQQAQL